MPKTDRNNPKRGSASESRYSIMEFERDFPDDAACLDWLVGELYPDGIFCPKCDKVTKHHRDTKRPSYSCQFCGRHEHPMKGTIFENSATSLKLWFHGIYLMSSTRCGISAKQLERELGVTYKTAWRMFHKIRTLLTQDDAKFDGTVEIDEAFIGGKAKWDNNRKRVGGGTAGKIPVVGIAQRARNSESGKIKAEVAPSVRSATLLPIARRNISQGSTVYSDERWAYRHLPEYGYEHGHTNHAQKVYVHGNVHTNTIEGFWSLLKRGISGVYHGVGDAHLQSYLDEYVFRYNNRDATGRGMMDAFLNRIEKVAPPA